MHEFLDSFCALESTLDQRDELQRVREPLAVIYAVATAIGSIQCCEEGPARLRIQPSDTLQTIYEHVRQLFDEIVLPAHYRSFWDDAIRDLAEEVRRYTANLKKLRAMPCATRRQRRKALAEDYGASITGASRDYDRAPDDPAVFARWKQDLETFLLRLLADHQALERRIRENRPPGFPEPEADADRPLHAP